VLRNVAIAIAFLTRVPVRVPGPVADGSLAGAAPWFPIAGLLVGAAAAAMVLAATAVGVPPLVAAALAALVTALVTGALHEDGLADTADALGVADRARALEVMRDSRIGSFGAVALVTVLVARIGAVAALVPPERAAAALLAAAALSRAALPVVLATGRSARSSGLAAAAGRPGAARVGTGLAIATVITLAALPAGVAVITIAVTALVAAAVAAALDRRFGGCTGDTLGAVQQTAELACLTTVAAAWR
jgi:adenosylcobinamide-GDP ribazoletransferase